MPIKSKAQQRAMYAAASGSGKTDIPKKVAEDFIEATPKSAYKDMPERAKKKKRVAMRRRNRGGN
jgi:hypothetical protein